MSYEKVNAGAGWDESTDLSAANLAQMDDGIAEAHEYRAQIVTGTYTGDGSSSRDISTPFTPSMVWVVNGGSPAYYGQSQPGGPFSSMALLGLSGSGDTGDVEATADHGRRPRVIDDGFRVGTPRMNANGVTYRYTALG